jgi:hypothetical protein
MDVQSQELIIVRCGVRSDQEVGKNPARAEVAMLSTSFRVTAKGIAGRSPNRFTQFPINDNSGINKERADEIFGAPWGGDQFSEHGRGHGEISATVSGFERGASEQSHPWGLVPQGDKDIRVDRGCHS